MKYDFDAVTPRRGTDSYKWDSAPADDILPMWVADMDFKTAPAVTAALIKRAEHGIFGYTKVPADYYAAVNDWFSRRHGWAIKPESVIYTSGVVPAISAIIRAMTKPGDKVLAQTPVYNCFFSSIRNQGCELVPNPLRYENGVYSMDWDDLERKAADPQVTLMLLCNPHNPVGRVWTRAELERIADICLRNGVFVVSDEIHCELTYEGHDYTPFATVSESAPTNSAVCISPSKAFNLAGIQIANIVAQDEDVRRRIDKAINIHEVCDVNAFSVAALKAAYNEGEAWLEELKSYLYENYLTVKNFLAAHLPRIVMPPLEGTYLLWLDCAALGVPASELVCMLTERGRVMLNGGEMYGDDEDRFIRMNIACPRSVLMDGLERMKKVLSAWAAGATK